jgi:hypothetical protein
LIQQVRNLCGAAVAVRAADDGLRAEHDRSPVGVCGGGSVSVFVGRGEIAHYEVGPFG